MVKNMAVGNLAFFIILYIYGIYIISMKMTA